jgi:hypothetical protein
MDRISAFMKWIDVFRTNGYATAMIATLLSYVLAVCCPLVQPPGETVESLGLGVLVTDSGKTYEGRIDRVGKLFRVMSGGRTEIIRDVNVSFTGQTKEEAFDFLRTKLKTDSAEDAAKLADWCLKNGLPRQALDEAKAAAKLAPNDRAIAKLVKDCEENARKAVTQPVIRVVGAGAPPTSTVHAPPPQTLPAMPGAGQAKPVALRSTELELSFAKTVQPVLMNLCVNCHADQSRAGSFRLARIPEGITVTPKTAENVAAAMSQLSRERPEASPLLVYAVTPHGGKTTPPLIRTATAFKNLEAWATAALAAIPELAKSVVLVSGTTPVSPMQPMPVVTPAVPPPVTPVAPPPVTPPVVPPTPKPVDPFDPAEFNKSRPKK